MAQRREPCLCGGVVVALDESPGAIARAVRQHHQTMAHKRWRDRNLRVMCSGVGGSKCSVMVPNDGRGMCHFCQRTAEMVERVREA